MEVEAQIIEAILRFESTEDTGAALDASLLLKSSDPTVGRTVAERQRLRERHTLLWTRLLSAITDRRDPTFDPNDPNSVPALREVLDEDYPVPEDPDEVYVASPYTHPDPRARERFAARVAAAAERNRRLNRQFKLYKLDRQVTEMAEEYFTTAFVRSPQSVRTVEACTAQASPSRRDQIRGWVSPTR